LSYIYWTVNDDKKSICRRRLRRQFGQAIVVRSAYLATATLLFFILSRVYDFEHFYSFSTLCIGQNPLHQFPRSKSVTSLQYK